MKGGKYVGGGGGDSRGRGGEGAVQKYKSQGPGRARLNISLVLSAVYFVNNVNNYDIVRLIMKYRNTCK